MDRDETIFALRQELADLRRERDEFRAADDARFVAIEAAIEESERRVAEMARAQTRALAAALRGPGPAGGKPAAPAGRRDERENHEDRAGAADPGTAAKPLAEKPSGPVTYRSRVRMI